MRPPILFLAVAFGVGLWAGLDPFVFPGAALWGVAVSLVATSGWLAARAPLGAAVGIMGVAGMLWGAAAVRERDATCTGRWAAGGRAGEGHTRAVIVRLADPAPARGGIVDAEVLPGTCGGSVRLRWPEDHAARGGTTWVVAGKWSGLDRGGDMGLLVVRRMRVLDPVPRGRGALRDALAAKSTELFGARAPIVNALVFAPNARLDSDIRERYVRSGLAHLLSISGLHVGFMAAWLALILGKLHLAARARFGATAVLLLGYLWLLGFPAPAVRAGAMLVLADVARLRQRVVAPRGVVALAALGVLVQDPWALQSVGAWLSIAGVGAVVWAGRAFARAPRRASARRHAPHRADQRVRLRYRGADRCAGQSHRDPARRRRRAGSRDGAGTLVAWLGVGAPDRRRRGTGPGAARPRRPRRRPRAGRSHRDGRGVASGAVVGCGGRRCVVAVEFPAPPVADGGSPGVLCHGCRRDVVS